ncbi:MAG: DUF2628 domain-containing protein [Devosiaceae bacterium]
MRTYSVFEPPVLPGSLEEDALSLKFVRHGWSLAALFFPLVWMLVRRLWWALLFYVLFIVAIQVLGFVVHPAVTAALSVALALIIMLEAGQLKLETLAAKGYREVAIIQAKNQKEAELAFFTTWIGASAANQDDSGTMQTAAPLHRTVLRPYSARPPALPGLPN